MNKQFTITGLEVRPGHRLHLTYADGETFDVSIKPVIERAPVLKALQSAAVFRRAQIGDWGGSVTWGDDDLELAADNLRARAIEQAGGYSHELVLNWMARHALTLDQAAQALGLSRRMLAYYRSGEKPVPRTVGLACLGWEVERRKAA
ncbi:MAG: hypothetical protein GAK30_00384 [Paracidovorax wautersii]|uniref:DUF2442 domain-containing protein n=1 Tax=Paracidovorax wautersii TaxID=1177982 RepID=A0A7V8FS11_9BURK|nr:MAG: hypothetical protein GAK30_00384 [Paracidovorax wautersii]